MIRIRTKVTGYGEVFTAFSNDQWNQPGWQTNFSIPLKALPISEIIEVKVAQSFEEAGRNHLELCRKYLR